jgi:bacterial/archaeal transporter family-2 protein
MALPIQNLMLAGMVGRGLPYSAALTLNSLVGLVLLVTLNLLLYRSEFVSAVVETWEPWYLIPGLLGTGVMFALLVGFRGVGAVLTTVALIAGQVLAATAIDLYRAGSARDSWTGLTWLGLTLFVVGAAIIFGSRSHGPH